MEAVANRVSRVKSSCKGLCFTCNLVGGRVLEGGSVIASGNLWCKRTAHKPASPEKQKKTPRTPQTCTFPRNSRTLQNDYHFRTSSPPSIRENTWEQGSAVLESKMVIFVDFKHPKTPKPQPHRWLLLALLLDHVRVSIAALSPPDLTRWLPSSVPTSPAVE